MGETPMMENLDSWVANIQNPSLREAVRFVALADRNIQVHGKVTQANNQLLAFARAHIQEIRPKQGQKATAEG